MIKENYLPKPEWSYIQFEKYGLGKVFISNQIDLQFKIILIDSSVKRLRRFFYNLNILLSFNTFSIDLILMI